MCLTPEPADRQTDGQVRVGSDHQRSRSRGQASFVGCAKYVGSPSCFVSVPFHLDILGVAQRTLLSGSPVRKTFQTINLKVRRRQGWTLGDTRLNRYPREDTLQQPRRAQGGCRRLVYLHSLLCALVLREQASSQARR